MSDDRLDKLREEDAAEIKRRERERERAEEESARLDRLRESLRRHVAIIERLNLELEEAIPALPIARKTIAVLSLDDTWVPQPERIDRYVRRLAAEDSWRYDGARDIFIEWVHAALADALADGATEEEFYAWLGFDRFKERGL